METASQDEAPTQEAAVLLSSRANESIHRTRSTPKRSREGISTANRRFGNPYLSRIRNLTPERTMRDVIDKIKSNDRIPDILNALLEVHPDQYDDAHKLVNDTEVTQVGISIASRLSKGGVQATIAKGGLIFAYQLLTNCDGRRGLPDELLDDLGTSPSQGYRCVGVWEHFGEVLIKDPSLMSYFVVEALKILSAAGVNPLARKAAIAMARRKHKVRIRDAEELVAQFSESEGTSTSKASKKSNSKERVSKPQSLRGKNTPSIWEYAGKVIRFVVRPAKPKQTVDHQAVIADLEAALAQLRKEYDRVNAPQISTESIGPEVSHA